MRMNGFSERYVMRFKHNSSIIKRFWLTRMTSLVAECDHFGMHEGRFESEREMIADI